MKKIAVIDFGGQYTHLIANRVRNLGVYSEIHQPEDFQPKQEPEIAGIILSGGPHSVTEPGHPTLRFDIADNKLPILGLCYGHQLLAQLLGGTVEKGTAREYGPADITCDQKSRLFSGFSTKRNVWMSHGDHVEVLPPNCRSIAFSPDLPVAAFESDCSRYFGLQFHPEVSNTERGMEIILRFLEFCTTEKRWVAGSYAEEIIERIKYEADNKKLLLLLSGGVDSLVALELCIKAVGVDRVCSIHVDTGLMRENESAEIISHLESAGFRNIKIVDAESLFLNQLSGVWEPEKKREIIGRLFIELVDAEIAGIRDKTSEWKLVQGTIYPDRIESGATRNSAKIKTHHNRVDAVKKMIERGMVIEPLKDLYKDEVRSLGRELKLPECLISRHPFPGPGLGVRILASSDEMPEPGYNSETEKLERILSAFDLAGLILPVKSVGVQGDQRTYLHPAVVWYKNESDIYWSRLKECSRAVINELKTVNRVVFSPYEKVSTVALIISDVNKQRADLLRRVDAEVRHETETLPDIWQMPVISLPAVDEKGLPIFVLRPVTSENAMTADFYRMDQKLLRSLYDRLGAIKGIGRVFYDITPKPPGTIEWE